MARTEHTFLCRDNANGACSVPHAIAWAETFIGGRLAPFRWFDKEGCSEGLGALSRVVWELALF